MGGRLFNLFVSGKNYSSLTLNAPTVYQWFLQGDFLTFSRIGILFSASAICAFIFLVYKKRGEVSGDHIIKISFALLSMVPFFYRGCMRDIFSY